MKAQSDIASRAYADAIIAGAAATSDQAMALAGGQPAIHQSLVLRLQSRDAAQSRRDVHR